MIVYNNYAATVILQGASLNYWPGTIADLTSISSQAWYEYAKTVRANTKSPDLKRLLAETSVTWTLSLNPVWVRKSSWMTQCFEILKLGEFPRWSRMTSPMVPSPSSKTLLSMCKEPPPILCIPLPRMIRSPSRASLRASSIQLIDEEETTPWDYCSGIVIFRTEW